jgi:hypothetical protein
MNNARTIVPRERLDCGLDGDIPKYWLGTDAFKTHFCAAKSRTSSAKKDRMASCTASTTGDRRLRASTVPRWSA